MADRACVLLGEAERQYLVAAVERLAHCDCTAVGALAALLTPREVCSCESCRCHRAIVGLADLAEREGS